MKRRVVAIDELTPRQRELVLALVEARRNAESRKAADRPAAEGDRGDAVQPA